MGKIKTYNPKEVTIAFGNQLRRRQLRLHRPER